MIFSCIDDVNVRKWRQMQKTSHHLKDNKLIINKNNKHERCGKKNSSPPKIQI